MVGGSAEVVGVGEDDVGVGEGELHFAFVDSEDAAQFGALEFEQEAAHVGQDLFEEVQRVGTHGRLL